MSEDQQRRRPDHTLVVVGPGFALVESVALLLIEAHCTFTMEYREAHTTWHVGLFADGMTVVTNLYGDRLTHLD